MASTPNDNVRVLAPKDIDDKKGRFVSGAWRPYLSVAEANQYNVTAYRYRFQEVLIKATADAIPTVYWYQGGTADSNLVVKPGGTSTNTLTPLYRTAGPYKFDNELGVFYGTPVAPLSGNIALDSTDAIDGTNIVIYHQAATEPTITGGTIDKKGAYDVNALNRIFVLREIGNYYLVNIWSNAEVVSEPPAVTLSSINATANPTTINEGGTGSTITVTATYSDGSTANVTNQAILTKELGPGSLSGNVLTVGANTITADESTQIDVAYTEAGVTRYSSVLISVINTTGTDTTAPTAPQNIVISNVGSYQYTATADTSTDS